MSLHPRPPAALLRAPPRRLGSTALSSSPPRGSCSGPSRSRCAASCLSSAARRRCGIPRWCSSSRRCPSAHILLAVLPSLPAPDRTISTAISTAKCPRSHRPRIRQQPCHRPCQYSPINADRPFVSPIRPARWRTTPASLGSRDSPSMPARAAKPMSGTPSNAFAATSPAQQSRTNASRSMTAGRSCIDSSTPSTTGRLMSCSTRVTVDCRLPSA